MKLFNGALLVFGVVILSSCGVDFDSMEKERDLHTGSEAEESLDDYYAQLELNDDVENAADYGEDQNGTTEVDGVAAESIDKEGRPQPRKGHPSLNKEQILSLLFEESKAVYSEVLEQMKSYNEEIALVCAKESDLFSSIKAQLDEVRDSDNDVKTKIEMAKEIFVANREDILSEKEQRKTCITENEDSLADVLSAKKSLGKACLIKPAHKRPFSKVRKAGGERTGENRKDNGKLYGENQGVDRDEKKANMIEKLETKLNSEECSAELSQ